MIASAAGLATGVTGLLSGCNSGQEVSNTTATVHPGRTTSTTVGSAAPSATIVTGPEAGREIKLGLVSALTGPLALFGKADQWWVSLAAEALPNGVVCGDRKLHKLVPITYDSRSDPKLAAEAAAHLILDARVDAILCSGGTDLVVPVAAQAEALICPCLCSFVQWRPFASETAGAAGGPFIWAYAHAVGVEDIAADFTAMWGQLQTNRKVGLLFPDSAVGRAWADSAEGLPPAAAAAGYEYVFPGFYPAQTSDFAKYVSEFRKNGCEIFCGVLSACDFVEFWRQVLQQGYQPKVVSVGEGLIFPHALEALGGTARGVTTECLWQPEWPYRDSITGKTCRELAEDYMAKTGDQWTPAIAQYAKFEWAVDIFRRVTDVNSRREIIAKAATTRLETCLGPLDFTAPVGASAGRQGRHPAENICKAPVGAAQWVQGDVFAVEPRLLSAVSAPGLESAGSLQPMSYGSS